MIRVPRTNSTQCAALERDRDYGKISDAHTVQFRVQVTGLTLQFWPSLSGMVYNEVAINKTKCRPFVQSGREQSTLFFSSTT